MKHADDGPGHKVGEEHNRHTETHKPRQGADDGPGHEVKHTGGDDNGHDLNDDNGGSAKNTGGGDDDHGKGRDG